MLDYFALLRQPRRPWLEPDALKHEFLARSAECHPDRMHGASEAEKQASQARYTELNSAYHALREPKDRLRHLLELERGTKPVELQHIPDDLMSVFLEVGESCRRADALLKEKAGADLPMLKVKMFQRSHQEMDRLASLKQRLTTQREGLTEGLKRIDAQWQANLENDPSQNQDMLDQLEALYRLLSYYNRWDKQLYERLVQLTF
jgi:DnaJ-domain-containing protein 1